MRYRYAQTCISMRSQDALSTCRSGRLASSPRGIVEPHINLIDTQDAYVTPAGELAWRLHSRRSPDRQRIRANLCSILANDILGVPVCVSRSVTARTHWSASSWRSDDGQTTLSVVRACQNTLISCTFGRDSWIRIGGLLLPKQSMAERARAGSGAG